MRAPFPPAWTYRNPVRVIFAPDAFSHLDDYVSSDRAALVTSPGFQRRGLVATVRAALGPRLVAVIDDVEPNPAMLDIEAQGERVRASAPDVLVALGGGSTIDTAKALARLLARPPGTRLSELLDDLEPEARHFALPVIAVPTTSGTGAEVTPFATLWDYEQGKKRSIAGQDLYPRLALLDPHLTLPLPPEVTISSGLDAVSHALESIWNRRASAVSLALATESLQRSLHALARVKEAPEDARARAEMLQASTLAGLAISQTRTALAHAISYPLTIGFGLPHGLACSFTLPALLVFNAASDDGRLAELARCLGCPSIGALAGELAELLRGLGADGYLAKYLPDRQSVLALADRMFTKGRAENNLRPASVQDVRAIVGEALDALRL